MSRQSLRPSWKMVKFGEVVKNANLVERDPETNDIERIVGLEHIEPDNLHIRRWNSVADGTSFTRKFVPGQTLFGKRRAYQRKVAFAEFEGICSGDILTFEPKNRKVLLPELLPFICQSDAFFDYALDTSAGSLSPRTSWTALQGFEFPLPPLDEQKRIAEILWAADEAVEVWREVTLNVANLFNVCANEVALNAKVNGAFVEMNKLASSEASSFTNGPFGSNLLTKELTDEGVPVIYVRDVKDGRYIRQENVCVTSEKAEELKACKTIPGDILFSKVGDPPGIASIYPEKEPDAIVTQDVIRLRVNTQKVNPEYLKFFFNSKPGRDSLNEIIIRGTRQRFSLRDFKKLKIPLPKLSDQIEAAQKLNEIEKKLEEAEKHLQDTVELQRSLTQGPLRGDNV
ncbi:restriction endonuclease subunit S [Marispirochaeta aestuarii]|nr:restriction endonuclease subunit S [Marispirochaeta aestuarii]